MLRQAVSLIVKNRWLMVTLVLLITALLASQVRNLRIVIDPASLLPQSHPNVIGTNAAEKLFGSKYVIVVGVSSADGTTVLTPPLLEVMARLTQRLADVPGVKRHTILSLSAERAKSIQGKDGTLMVEKMLNLPIDAKEIASLVGRMSTNPVYQNTLLSQDSTLASISFSVDITEKGFREVVDRVLAVTNAENNERVSIRATGTPIFFAAVERYSQRMGFLFPIALILIGLLHFEAFRTLQGMILPLVTAVIAVLWVLGIMGSARLPLDAFNATTPILILAVAAGHAVQILKRYYEEYDRLSLLKPDVPSRQINDEAIIESLSKIAPVMLTAGLVAAAGFFSLLFFDILTISNFGRITGLGILTTLFLELSFIPALRSVLKPPKAKFETPTTNSLALAEQSNADDSPLLSPKPRLWDRISENIANAAIHQRPKVLTVFACIIILSVVGMNFINRENSTKSYFGNGVEVRQQDAFLNSKLAGTNTLYVVFEGDRENRVKDPELLAAIEQTQRYIETLPDVGKTVSIVDFIKQMNRSMHDGDISKNMLPASSELISQYLLLYSMSGQPTDFDAYVDYDYRHANLVVWMKNDSSKYAEKVVSQIKAFAQARVPKGVTVQVGGSVPQTSALSETLVRSKILNIVQMISVVLVAGIVVFRSVLAGIYLIVPLLVTVAVNFGLMGLTGVPLNTPNSVSAAMAIGIGADYAIYLMFRIREELAKGTDLESAIRTTLRTAGKAVVYVATAVATGYAVLMLSFNFYVHIWFGMLIVMSMVTSACTALLLVPALIMFKPPRFFRVGSARGHPVAALTVLIALLSVVPAKPAYAGEHSALDLMDRSYQSSRFDTSTSRASFQLTSASGQQRVRQTYGATKLESDGERNRRMIRFLAPSDVRNTVTVIVENNKGDDEIWVYLPALKKARRLANNNKRGSFVGTDLSYGDVIGHKPRDWNHKTLRQEALEGVASTVVESLPNSAEVSSDSGYSKRVSWIANDSFMALKVDFYDAGGALLKTLHNRRIKLVDASKKKWQAMQVDVKHHQSGHRTSIVLEQFTANTVVTDELFSVRYMEREE
jgi:uncharacterized protein